jgi:hypothetical protein
MIMMSKMFSGGADLRPVSAFRMFRPLRLTPLALVAVVALSAGPARAADDEDDRSVDSRIIDSVLKNFGLRSDGEAIDYRERSPLVVPPRVDLPPPAKATAPVANWPRDPDVRRAKEAAAMAARRRSRGFEEEGRPLTPAELNRGVRPSGRSAETTPGAASTDTFRVLSPSELGFKGFGRSFGLKTEESAPFTGEPERGSLTQPPVGYQTPSPNYAYGVGPAKPGTNAVLDESRPLPPGKY